jgi:hypothetical protein
MDAIQKELIKAGRKDLAQEYYTKVAKIKVGSTSYVVVFKNESDAAKFSKEKDIKNSVVGGYGVYRNDIKDYWMVDVGSRYTDIDSVNKVAKTFTSFIKTFTNDNKDDINFIREVIAKQLHIKLPTTDNYSVGDKIKFRSRIRGGGEGVITKILNKYEIKYKALNEFDGSLGFESTTDVMSIE